MKQRHCVVNFILEYLLYPEVLIENLFQILRLLFGCNSRKLGVIRLKHAINEFRYFLCYRHLQFFLRHYPLDHFLVLMLQRQLIEIALILN